MSTLIRDTIATAKRAVLARREIEPIGGSPSGPDAARLQHEARAFDATARPLFEGALVDLHAYLDTGIVYSTDHGAGLVIDQNVREEFGNRSVASKFEYSYRTGPDLVVTRTIRGGAGSVQAVEKTRLETALARWLGDAILARSGPPRGSNELQWRLRGVVARRDVLQSGSARSEGTLKAFLSW